MNETTDDVYTYTPVFQVSQTVCVIHWKSEVEIFCLPAAVQSGYHSRNRRTTGVGCINAHRSRKLRVNGK